LPILLTDVPHNANEIARRNCGVIVDYDKGAIATAIIDLLSNDNRLKTFRENAVKFAASFDWNAVFGGALCPN
jgi:glycosyltransferase involved in cell wall biosynthesis